jgi:hypothetical protein
MKQQVVMLEMLIDPFFSKQLPVFHKAILMQA